MTSVSNAEKVRSGWCVDNFGIENIGKFICDIDDNQRKDRDDGLSKK